MIGRYSPLTRYSPLALVAIIGLTGCSKEQAAVAKSPVVAAAPVVAAPSPKESPVALAQADGTLTGTILWKDDLPKETVLDLKANGDKAACEKKGPVPDEFAVVNPKNKGLRDAFVWLEPVEKGAKFNVPAALAKPKEPKVVLDQPHCAFIPHALILREGQVLVAKNTATMAHNFKWQGSPSTNDGGNKLLPPGGEVEIEDLKADRLPITMECNIHPWMKGYIRVFDHPYYAITDADGKFSIPNAPTGALKLKIWHGSKGWLDGAKGKNGKDVTISGGAQDLGTFNY